MELVSTAETTKDYIKWKDREKKDSLKSKPLHRELINIVDELVEEEDVNLDRSWQLLKISFFIKAVSSESFSKP